MKILVTGSNGQLGKTFQHYKSNEYNYIFCNRNDLNLIDKIQIVKVLNNIKPKIIINCAAYTAVDDAEKNENLASSINFEAVEIISNWCYENHAYLIHFSTDYVFDGKKNEPYLETDVPNPLSVYGKTKFLSEQAFLKSKCHGICLRTSWVHSNYGKNFFLTIKNLLLQNQIVKIIDDQFGVPTTTNFIVKITEIIIKKTLKKYEMPKILHVVPSNYTNWYEFGHVILENLKRTKNKKLFLKCKEVSPISTYEFKQIAKRPKFSVLSNKSLK